MARMDKGDLLADTPTNLQWTGHYPQIMAQWAAPSIAFDPCNRQLHTVLEFLFDRIYRLTDTKSLIFESTFGSRESALNLFNVELNGRV